MPQINTYRELEKYYERYLSNECSNQWEPKSIYYPRQMVFPGRCARAREYVQSMREFVENARAEDKESLPDDKAELEERIENEEHKNIYPLLNHDYNYTTMVKKQYTPYALNITNKPTFSGLEDGLLNNMQYVRALLFDPLPNPSSTAGVTDAVIENPERQEIIDKTRAEDAKLPYPTFRKDYPECLYPTKGLHASSYFVKVGQCPTSIKSQAVCLGRGYTWTETPNPPPESDNFMEPKSAAETDGTTTSRPADVPPPPKPPREGTCFKPRFIYVNNRAKGFAQMDGIVISGLGDLREIAPDRLYSIMNGQSVNGAGILPCVDEEGFVGSMNENTSLQNPSKSIFDTRLSFLIIVVSVLILFMVFMKKTNCRR